MIPLQYREGTYDDGIINEVIQRDIYCRHTDLHPDQTWLDIGGHIGTFAYRIAPHVGMVISIEPDPQAYDYLQRNTQQFNNVVALHGAVTSDDSSSPTRKFYPSTGQNLSTGRSTYTRGRSCIEVPSYDLTALLHKYAITHVKLDAEGIEQELWQGLLERPSLSALVGEYHHTINRGNLVYHKRMEELRARFPHVIATTRPKKAWTTMFWAWE